MRSRTVEIIGWLAIFLLLSLVVAVRGYGQTLTITQQKTITITTTQKTVTAKATNSTANRRDYVGIYQAGSITWLDWFYVASGTHTQAAQGVTTGTVKFPNLKPGNYEAKLYSLTDAGVTTLKDTVPFTVGLTGIETEGLTLKVTKRATNDPDTLTFVVDGPTGTVTVPKDTTVVIK